MLHQAGVAARELNRLDIKNRLPLPAAAEDREANWNAEDVRVRMEFSLRCAYAHGTAALRTHLDSLGKQAAISWPSKTAMSPY